MHSQHQGFATLQVEVTLNMKSVLQGGKLMSRCFDGNDGFDVHVGRKPNCFGLLKLIASFLFFEWKFRNSGLAKEEIQEGIQKKRKRKKNRRKGSLMCGLYLGCESQGGMSNRAHITLLQRLKNFLSKEHIW